MQQTWFAAAAVSKKKKHISSQDEAVVVSGIVPKGKSRPRDEVAVEGTVCASRAETIESVFCILVLWVGAGSAAIAELRGVEVSPGGLEESAESDEGVCSFGLDNFHVARFDKLILGTSQIVRVLQYCGVRDARVGVVSVERDSPLQLENGGARISAAVQEGAELESGARRIGIDGDGAKK